MNPGESNIYQNPEGNIKIDVRLVVRDFRTTVLDRKYVSCNVQA